MQNPKNREFLKKFLNHDVKTPLRGINQYSLALMEDLEGKLSDEEKRHLERINFLSSFASTLLDDAVALLILSYSRPNLKPVDLCALAKQSFEQAVEFHSEKNAKLEISDFPQLCLGEQQLLDEVFCCLFSNAIRHNDKKEKCIKVSFLESDFRKSHLCVCVEDNGPGISKENEQYLFSLLNPSRLKRKNRISRGLFIARNQIEFCGGMLDFECLKPFGTKFYFHLPRAKDGA